MTRLLLCLAVIIAALVWRESRVPLRHRWRGRQARIMCDALRCRDRSQSPALIHARLWAMDALAIKERLLESVERRGHRVTRNRRNFGDGGIDGQGMIDGRTRLIQAKRYASAIRPEHVQAFASLCVARGARGLLIHTGRNGDTSRGVIARHATIEIVSGNDCWRSAHDRREAVMTLWLGSTLLLAATSVPGDHEFGSKGASIAQERVVARCIRDSARGKKWLESVLWAIREQERGWVGASVRNGDGSHDLGPMQINSWWVPRLARLLSRSPEVMRHALRYDACFNVEAARWILLLELSRTREIWAAVAGYHSCHPATRSRYLNTIAEKIR